MASKSKRRRRVLGASCILAALIIAGSSFAWFTSKDEVTNRLTASADYGVTIAEDFTPPENWVPGQQINKDVSAVNTGSVDAFVRMWMDGEMRILQTTAAENTNLTIDNWTSGTGFNAATLGYFNTTATTNDVEDTELIKMGLTKFYMDGTSNPRYYFKTLNKTSTKNPRDNQQSNYQDDYNNENNTDYYSEVQSMQAGGFLAYAPTGAEYTYVLNQETELPIYSTDGTTTSSVTRKVPAGTRVYVTNTAVGSANANWLVSTTADMSTINTVWVAAQTFTAGSESTTDHFNPVNIDADSFQPLTPGLYLFARNVDLDATDANPNDYEFSGYYYSDFDTEITDANGTTSMTHTQYNNAVATSQLTTNGGTAWVDATTGKITAANGDYGKGTYYALKAENDLATGDNRSDYTVPNGTTGSAVTVTELDNDFWYVAPTDNLELYTANYSTIDAANLRWRTTADVVNDKKIYAIYDKNGDGVFNEASDIVIEIGLTNLGTGAAQWTPKNTDSTVTGYTLGTVTAETPASLLTFYYNDDVESGDTSERLIDYVKLSELVTDDAYIAFDFDLNVYLESVQVTMDEAGNEQLTPVHAWDATAGKNTGADATATTGNPEINSITWSDHS